jgi:hypothetical protein
MISPVDKVRVTIKLVHPTTDICQNKLRAMMINAYVKDINEMKKPVEIVSRSGLSE